MKSEKVKVLDFLKRNAFKFKNKEFSLSEIVNIVKSGISDLKLKDITLNSYIINDAVKRGILKKIDANRYIFLVGTEEKDVYKPLKEFLINESIITRGLINASVLRKTLTRYNSQPDIIGILKDDDFYKYSYSASIVSVEVKLDDSQLKDAIGQACIYKLFSNYVYICLPKDVRDINTLVNICFVNGIGLITFKVNQSDFVFNIELPSPKNNPIDSYAITVLKDNFK